MICKHCIVTGRVQGVWFRYHARQQAMQLGISGYARNLADGSVEVLACGNEQAVQRFSGWLGQGSPLARVDEVRCQDTEARQSTGFEIR